jgi:hypothetical protein
MTLEHIATTDFLPMVAVWGAMYAITYTYKKDPKGLLAIEDLKKRQAIRQNYLNNHVSVLHAVVMCVLSKCSQ